MQKEQIRILAINPGSRYLGFAVFYETDLREWKIHAMRQGPFREKAKDLRLLISDIVARYGVNTLATKELHQSRSSKELRKVASSIKSMGKAMELKVCEFSLNEVEDHFFPRERTNKRELMEQVASRYPFLFPELQREQKSKHPYLIRMFEAIAIGVVCCNELDSRKRKVGRSSN
jgi:hypothetical protein